MFLKSIKDIQIIDGDISICRKVNCTTQDIKNQISNLPYTGNGRAKNSLIENAKLPPFIQVFYYLFYTKLRVPSEELFFKTYIEWNEGQLGEKYIKINGKSYYQFDIQSRLLRTYPSLIRDLHFYYLLHESKQFTEVKYSLYTDYIEGLDIKLNYKNTEYYLSLYIGTQRSKDFKIKKINRHDYGSCNEIEYSVNFSSLEKEGNFFLLNKEHVINIIKLLNH